MDSVKGKEIQDGAMQVNCILDKAIASEVKFSYKCKENKIKYKLSEVIN